MSQKPHPAIRIIAGLVLVIPVALFAWKAMSPAKIPSLPKWKAEREQVESLAARSAEKRAAEKDAKLVRQLLAENLSDRRFSFATVAEACSGKKVIPLGKKESHTTVVAAINRALEESLVSLSKEDSPVRSLRRINEASKFFEDALHKAINAEPDLACGVPVNRNGKAQRSGYPDLRIEHLPSGDVFYLDPKLVENGSWKSSFRTFYFEPKDETLKITEDAVHLLAGIGHDGNDGAWAFTQFKLVDLSELRVRLKAEFQASNADLYPAK